MGTSRRSDLETCEKNSGVLDRRKRARCIVSVAMNLSPSMDDSALEVQYWQNIDAFHSVLLSCRANKPPYISKQRLQRPLVARKNGLFLFRMPGDVSLLYCERSAGPSHGALARRDEEID